MVMERIVLHIDVNSAFLSWSAVKLLKEGNKKDIRNEISVVSGRESTRNGIIVASSIPAKKIGIRAPMNLRDARKINRDIIVVHPDYYFYADCSKKLFDYIRSLFEEVEQFSIDECFVEYTPNKRMYGDEVKFAYKLKDYIKKKYGFTVNIGIGNNKLLAKMASDFEKPDKVHTLYTSEIKEKMWPLDISDLFMAGKSSCNKLRRMGINTIGELANYDENKLYYHMKSMGKMLHDFANGVDDSKVEFEYRERKGIGFSRTLEDDTEDKKILFEYLNTFSKDISDYLKKKNKYAGVIVVTIRYKDFKTYNHQIKLKNNINDKESIYKYSKELFNKLWNYEPVRLIGLRVTDLSSNNDIQLSLFDENEKVIKDKEIDKLLDSINDKLGKDSVYKASLIEKNK